MQHLALRMLLRFSDGLWWMPSVDWVHDSGPASGSAASTSGASTSSTPLSARMRRGVHMVRVNPWWLWVKKKTPTETSFCGLFCPFTIGIHWGFSGTFFFQIPQTHNQFLQKDQVRSGIWSSCLPISFGCEPCWHLNDRLLSWCFKFI